MCSESIGGVHAAPMKEYTWAIRKAYVPPPTVLRPHTLKNQVIPAEAGTYSTCEQTLRMHLTWYGSPPARMTVLILLALKPALLSDGLLQPPPVPEIQERRNRTSHHQRQRPLISKRPRDNVSHSPATDSFKATHLKKLRHPRGGGDPYHACVRHQIKRVIAASARDQSKRHGMPASATKATVSWAPAFARVTVSGAFAKGGCVSAHRLRHHFQSVIPAQAGTHTMLAFATKSNLSWLPALATRASVTACQRSPPEQACHGLPPARR